MTDELRQFEPHILGILGGSLQWLRGYSKFPDWSYQIIAVVLAFGGFLLFNPLLQYGVREAIICSIVGVSANMLVVWGGTFLASNASKAGVAVIPMTNSK